MKWHHLIFSTALLWMLKNLYGTFGTFSTRLRDRQVKRQTRKHWFVLPRVRINIIFAALWTYFSKCTQIYLSGHNGHNEREVTGASLWATVRCYKSLTSLAVLVHFPATYQSISSVKQKMLWFSVFSFSPLFHSVLSFTVCWAFHEDSVSRRLTVCVYLCVYTKVRQGVYPRWWWQDLICFLFFFPTVFCYLEKVCMDTSVQRALVAEVWRSLSSLSLHHTHLSRRKKK